MYTALYRAYRPETFEEILGQEHIVKILKNQLATDTVSHAYLFCGTRGTGKTTTARILAKGVNCLSEGQRPCGHCDHCKAIKDGIFIDVIEIDAASNNGVENIRELRESVKYPPVNGRRKVYIIDEVHMLSTAASNALLKTLEEPPENVMFILATTEPQKLPATILSRCMRLDFRRVSENVLCQGMENICKQKGLDVEKDALKLIAANADGSVRDGLSILDQCISGGQTHITRSDVLEFLGTAGEDVFTELTGDILIHNSQDALLLLDKVLADGKDVRQFMKDWLAYYRSLLIIKFIKTPEDILNMSCENIERIREQSERLDLTELNDSILELSGTINEAKWSTQPRILLELCIVKLASGFGATQIRSAVQVKPPALQANTTGVPSTRVTPTAATINGHVSDSQMAPSSQTNQSSIGNGSTAAKGAATAMDAAQLDELWHAVFEDGEASKGSFNIIRGKTSLVLLSEGRFVVNAENDMVKTYVEDNRETLEMLLEKHTGTPRRMECRLIDREVQPEERQTEEIAADIGDLLGVRVEIE